AFNDHSEKILLSDVKALTLHHGQMTKSRRSPAVPQLKCVGGSAHYKFTPKVVQCINKGSDGYDIQWECKTDMDNAYRFGHVEVTCEGYDYPNDPYVLKGSCGLEYTLEFTEEGLQRERQKGGYNYHGSYKFEGSSGGVNGLIFVATVILLMYFIYKVCIAPTDHSPEGTAENNPHPMVSGQNICLDKVNLHCSPPPTYDSCGGAQGFTNPGFASAAPGTGGGFWTGAATGGLLGYLFGRTNNYNYGPTYRPASSWFSQDYAAGPSTSSSSFFSSPPSGGSSSGTRTASGYGGTSRR
ncbi:unnamed protein product, partial [Candidula unifasciata]